MSFHECPSSSNTFATLSLIPTLPTRVRAKALRTLTSMCVTRTDHLRRKVWMRYGMGDDNVAGSSRNTYYVKSVRIVIDYLRETYKLALYIKSAIMGCTALQTEWNSVYRCLFSKLTVDLESDKGVDSSESLISVEQWVRPCRHRFGMYNITTGV